MKRTETGNGYAGQARGLSLCFNALFLQNHLGGIGNYAYHIISEIRRLRPDWELTLLIHKGTAPSFAALEGVRLLVIPLRSRNLRLAYFHCFFPFRARRFGLLHSVGNMGMLFCPVPQVITIHDLYEQVSPERFSAAKRFLMKFLISFTGRQAKAIVTVSENTRRDIARYYPRLGWKTRVVYSGNKFPVTGQDSGAARMDFIFVGTIEPGKNLVHILQAFARFLSRHSGRLKVVGAAGWGQSHVPALLDSLGIRASVDFLGYIPDTELRALYANSLALVLASNYEGFGLPVVEAMACGCPVICARNSGLVEAGGDSALFFESGDIPGLADCMERMYLDEELRGRCIRTGLEHARKFTWERAAAETLAVFEAALLPAP